MKRKPFIFFLAMILALPACSFLLPGMVTVKPTSTAVILFSPPGPVETLDPTKVVPLPSEPANPNLATLQFVVLDANNQLALANPNLPLGPTYNPSFSGFLPAGGSVNQTAYVLDFTNGQKGVALDTNGTRDLSFIKKPTYALALWPGGETGQPQPRLAWGTQSTDASVPTMLQISNLDGSQLETVLSADPAPNRPEQLVAEFWSGDGQSLYFSREPVGIGGYIPFSGASSLYRIDIASKQVTTLIPSSSKMICLDAISATFRYVADHCSINSITVRDLWQNTSSTIQPPADISGYALLGSARFSPSGERLAFALAKGDPSDEQGWVAVSNSLIGASTLILTSKPGMLYSVQGWLDDQTLLLETRDFTCTASGCGPQLWTIGADGSNLHKAADGSFLAIIDNR